MCIRDRRYLLELKHRNSLGFEINDGRRILDSPVFFWFGHYPTFLRIFSLKSIMNIFSFVKRFVIL